MLASTVGLLATDLYVPSLPTLTEVFSASPETIQLTMTFNLAGFAVGQLFFGPLSDRFGRRTAMLLGLSLFCFAALGCALAWSAEALIVARVLLGLTGACEVVIGMAVIKELYGEEKGVKIVAIYAMVIAAALAVGPPSARSFSMAATSKDTPPAANWVNPMMMAPFAVIQRRRR